jgi:hypothetical protein
MSLITDVWLGSLRMEDKENTELDQTSVSKKSGGTSPPVI